MLMGLQYERPWLKGKKVNLDLWNLSIDTRLNISSENSDFGFHSIQKITFQKKKSHLNALGRKFDLAVK